MIVIKVELWSARTGKKTELGRTYITNERQSDNGKKADYRVRVQRKGKLEPTDTPLRTGWVHQYPKESYNVWRLVIRGLLACFHEERCKCGLSYDVDASYNYFGPFDLKGKE